LSNYKGVIISEFTGKTFQAAQLKVAFIQKVLMHLSFPQTDEPYFFPELEFCNFDISKGSNHVIQWPEVALKAQIRLDFAV
jgi:hypothetical protein